MSVEANNAVFLSCASQAADTARKICEALRAAEIEVWFDQSELRGGDAWDAKIRGQIASCALFGDPRFEALLEDPKNHAPLF